MMPLLSPAWSPTTTCLLRNLRRLIHAAPVQRLGHALIAAALLGASALSSAGYSTGGGTGSGTPGTPALRLTNTAINPTLNSGVASSTNPPTASFSVASPLLDAYLGYRLVFQNNTSLPIGGTITLSYTVSSLNAAPLPLYDSVVMPSAWTMGTCTVTSFSGGYTRTCPITQSTAFPFNPTQTRSLVIFLKSPPYGSGITGNACPTTSTAASGQCIRLAASATFNTTSTTNGANEEILLGAGGTTSATTASTRAIKAYTAVRPAGGTLFTGYDTATTTGQFYSQVQVPSYSSTFVTSAKILESTIACRKGSAFRACSRTDITVPAPVSTVPSFFPQLLQIQLRIDSSVIISPSAAGQAATTLYYVPTGSTTAVVIPTCSTPTTPLSVGSGPCKASLGSWAPGSDYIFNLISYTNGGYYHK